MKIRHWLATASLLSQVITPVLAQSATTPAAPATPPPPVPVHTVQIPAPPPPVAVSPANTASNHVRCDGMPALMSGGESFARFVGAVTLLGIFAPRPERADFSKRLTGKAGIEACTQVIDGPHADGNSLRRLQLILARAVHRIEATDYAGANADVEKARAEAKAINLVGNPYFDQSLGLSFDLLEAEIAYLTGDGAKAREIGLRNAARTSFSYMPMVLGFGFFDVNRTSSPIEDAVMRAKIRVLPGLTPQFAGRLEELGRFAEAAQLRDASAALTATSNSENLQASHHAFGAISWALAGDWEKAEWRAKTAREEIDQADAAGKPFAFRAQVIEILDLYAVLKLAHDGHVDDARRNFAARSEWPQATFGALVAITRLLRAGAKPDQLTGLLAKSEDAMWDERHTKAYAIALNRIQTSDPLYGYILPFAKINEYEMVSRKVWKGDRSGVISETPTKNSRFYSLNPRALEPIYRIVSPDALLLNAAVIAKARGFKGFVYQGNTATMVFHFVEFGNPGEQDMIDPFYIDADAVIAELRQLMPPPEELDARDKAAAKH
jgi:hypothetical protein